MVKSSKLLTIFVLLLAAGFVFSSCARTKVTGGGKIVNEHGKSTFTVNADSCDTDEVTGDPIVKGNLTYHSADKTIRIKGYITDAANCSEKGDLFSDKTECSLCNIIADIFVEDSQNNVEKPDRLLVKFQWYSQMPRDKSNYGFGIACMIDNGQGAGADPDLVGIGLFGGDIGHYVNWGEVQGNLKQHACPEPEEE